MDWNNILTPTPSVGGGTLLGGPQPTATGPQDFIGQQADMARQQLMAQQLRGMEFAYSGGQQGQIIGGRYIPNYQAMGQQFLGGLMQPGADAELTKEGVAGQRAQLSAAQEALKNMPQRFAAQEVDDKGVPIQPAQQQSFPEYKQAYAQKASELLAIPMTHDMGMQMIANMPKLDQDEVDRLQRLQIAKDTQANRLAMANIGYQKGVDVANIGANAKIYGDNMQAISKIVNSGNLDPTQRIKNELSAAQNVEKAGNQYGGSLKHMQDLIDNVKDMDQNGYDAVSTSALIDNYQKMVNPTGSVKDSQYYRIQGLAPIMDQIDMWLKRPTQGKVQVPPDIAHQMVRVAEVVNAQNRKNLYSITDAAAQQAQESGMDPNHVVRTEQWRNPDTVTAGGYTAVDPIVNINRRYEVVKSLFPGAFSGGAGGAVPSIPSTPPPAGAPGTNLTTEQPPPLPSTMAPTGGTAPPPALPKASEAKKEKENKTSPISSSPVAPSPSGATGASAAKPSGTPGWKLIAD